MNGVMPNGLADEKEAKAAVHLGQQWPSVDSWCQFLCGGGEEYTCAYLPEWKNM
jgi:hypothetical protein